MQQFTLKTLWSAALLALAVMLSGGVCGQIFESFETGLPTSYTLVTTYELASGTWTGQENGVQQGTSGVVSGSYSLLLRSTTGAQITTPEIFNGVGTISFSVSASTNSGSMQVRISTDNGLNWAQVSGSPISLNETITSQSFIINDPNVNKVQFYRTAATVFIDDIEISSTDNVIPTAGNVFISEVADASTTNEQYLELYNNSLNPISLSTSKLVMLNGLGVVETVWDLNTFSLQDIPPFGFFIITRGGSQVDFINEFGAINSNTVFVQGTTAMYFGAATPRRWQLWVGGTANTADGNLIDDTQNTVAGNTNRTYQNIFNSTFLTDARSNATPGELDYLLYNGGQWVNSIALGAATGSENALIYDDFVVSTNVEINDFYIHSGASITLSAGNTMDVNGTLTNNAGASGLVIESTGAGTGSLITSGTVTGDITVQRYIPGASEDWHLVSSPVSGQGISGDWIPAGTYPDGSGYDFYAWHEDGQIWVNRKNTNASPNGDAPRFDDVAVNGNLNFNAARGYLTAYQASNPTKAFTGAPFNANQTYNLSRSGVGSNAGLNLVGNPFPATIAGNVNADGTNNFLTANAAVLDDSFEAYYYWDTPSNDYVAVNQSSGAHFIEVGQGFFVVASADDAVLNFNTNLRKHGAATFYKSTIDRSALQIVVNTESGKINQTELVFDPAMSIGLDPGYDAAKLQGNTALSLYSLLPVPHERVFDIQSLPVPTEEMIVPIGITVDQPGVYHLTLNPTEAFEGSILASLYDKQTNTQLQIEGSTSYSFNIGEPGVYNQRFEIHFGALSINDNPGQLAATAYVHGGQLYILNGKGMTDIRVLDVQGRLLQSFQQHVEGVYSTGFNLPAGMYIIQLQDAQGVRNNKVIKQ